MAPNKDKEKSSGFDLAQKVKFLKKINFFDNFDNHELKQFLSVTRWLKVPKGTHIIKEDTRDRAFYILVKGEVSVVKSAPNQQKPMKLTTLTSGACFGEMSLVMDVKRTAGVITDNDCFILMVEPEIINTSNVFLQVKFYKRFCEILVSRLIMANEKIAGQPQQAAKPAAPKPKQTTTNEPRAKEEKESKPEEYHIQDDTVMVLPSVPDKKDRIVKRKIKKQLKSPIHLPVNPTISAQITDFLREECDNTRMFSDLIQQDPILSCKVIQIANSTFFRRTTPVATIAHALITVGNKHIQEAILETIQLSRKESIAFSNFKGLAASFWRHSILVARIACMLKDIIRLPISSDVYLAGLIHDIGILALDSTEPNFYPHLIDPASDFKKDLIESEKSFIGVDHGEAGCWLAESLGLPQAYQDVICYHHTPEKAKDNNLLVALVHLADLFASERKCGVGGGGYSPRILSSFGWTVIQDQHRPFLDVNVTDFVATFNHELDKTWSGLTDKLNF